MAKAAGRQRIEDEPVQGSKLEAVLLLLGIVVAVGMAILAGGHTVASREARASRGKRM